MVSTTTLSKIEQVIRHELKSRHAEVYERTHRQKICGLLQKQLTLLTSQQIISLLTLPPPEEVQEELEGHDMYMPRFVECIDVLLREQHMDGVIAKRCAAALNIISCANTEEEDPQDRIGSLMWERRWFHELVDGIYHHLSAVFGENRDVDGKDRESRLVAMERASASIMNLCLMDKTVHRMATEQMELMHQIMVIISQIFSRVHYQPWRAPQLRRNSLENTWFDEIMSNLFLALSGITLRPEGANAVQLDGTDIFSMTLVHYCSSSEVRPMVLESACACLWNVCNTSERACEQLASNPSLQQITSSLTLLSKGSIRYTSNTRRHSMQILQRLSKFNIMLLQGTIPGIDCIPRLLRELEQGKDISLRTFATETLWRMAIESTKKERICDFTLDTLITELIHENAMDVIVYALHASINGGIDYRSTFEAITAVLGVLSMSENTTFLALFNEKSIVRVLLDLLPNKDLLDTRIIPNSLAILSNLAANSLIARRTISSKQDITEINELDGMGRHRQHLPHLYTIMELLTNEDNPTDVRNKASSLIINLTLDEQSCRDVIFFLQRLIDCLKSMHSHVILQFKIATALWNMTTNSRALALLENAGVLRTMVKLLPGTRLPQPKISPDDLALSDSDNEESDIDVASYGSYGSEFVMSDGSSDSDSNSDDDDNVSTKSQSGSRLVKRRSLAEILQRRKSETEGSQLLKLTREWNDPQTMTKNKEEALPFRLDSPNEVSKPVIHAIVSTKVDKHEEEEEKSSDQHSMEEQESAAIRIQSCLRGYFNRKRMQLTKGIEKEEQLQQDEQGAPIEQQQHVKNTWTQEFIHLNDVQEKIPETRDANATLASPPEIVRSGKLTRSYSRSSVRRFGADLLEALEKEYPIRLDDPLVSVLKRINVKREYKALRNVPVRSMNLSQLENEIKILKTELRNFELVFGRTKGYQPTRQDKNVLREIYQQHKTAKELLKEAKERQTQQTEGTPKEKEITLNVPKQVLGSRKFQTPVQQSLATQETNVPDSHNRPSERQKHKKSLSILKMRSFRNKRSRILKEFYDEEILYLDLLNITSAVLGRAKTFAKHINGITLDIIDDFECIHLITSDFFADLDAEFGKEFQMDKLEHLAIGKIFMRRLPTLRMYKTYVRNYQSSMEEFKKETELISLCNASIQEAVKMSYYDHGPVTLFVALEKPITHIMNYTRHMKMFQECTPRESNDVQYCAEALRQLTILSDHCGRLNSVRKSVSQLPAGTGMEQEQQEREKKERFMAEDKFLSANKRYFLLFNYGFTAAQNSELDQWISVFSKNKEKRPKEWKKLLPKEFLDVATLAGSHMLLEESVMRKMRQLVTKHLPASYRPRVWFVLSGASRKASEGEGLYQKILSTHKDAIPERIDEIERDLLSMPVYRDHPLFADLESPSYNQIRRILIAYAWRNPLIGYNVVFIRIIAFLLLHYGEEEAFWMFVQIVEGLTISPLPQNYFTQEGKGAWLDQMVLEQLVAEKLPKLHNHLREHDLQLSDITFPWLQGLLVYPYVPVETCMRIWDLMFCHRGTLVLIETSFAILALCESDLLRITNAHYMKSFFRDQAPRKCFDVDQLFAASRGYSNSSSSRSLVKKNQPLLDEGRLNGMRANHMEAVEFKLLYMQTK